MPMSPRRLAHEKCVEQLQQFRAEVVADNALAAADGEDPRYEDVELEALERLGRAAAAQDHEVYRQWRRLAPVSREPPWDALFESIEAAAVRRRP